MSSLEVSLWWDRDTDRNGRPIRPDVRTAASAVWTTSCRKGQSQLGDGSQAAELMESAVAQVSRYLDKNRIPEFSRDLEGLVTHSFHRAVQRALLKQNRVVSLEFLQRSNGGSDHEWAKSVESQLEYEEIVAFLPQRSQTILALRYAGYTWKETALILGDSVTALRSSFWRDVSRLRSNLKKHRSFSLATTRKSSF